MHVLLVAPAPNTDLINLPGWVQTAAVLSAIALALATWSINLRNPKPGTDRKPHPGASVAVGVISLLLFTTAVAAAATQKFIAQLLGIGTGVSSEVVNGVRNSGWPLTVGGIALFVALICAFTFLFKSKTLRSGLGWCLGFAVALFIAGDFFLFVSKALESWYGLLNTVF